LTLGGGANARQAGDTPRRGANARDQAGDTPRGGVNERQAGATWRLLDSMRRSQCTSGWIYLETVRI